MPFIFFAYPNFLTMDYIQPMKHLIDKWSNIFDYNSSMILRIALTNP